MSCDKHMVFCSCNVERTGLRNIYLVYLELGFDRAWIFITTAGLSLTAGVTGVPPVCTASMY